MNTNDVRAPKRIPPYVLEEQWYSFVHSLIEKMQVAYRSAQKNDPSINQKTIAIKLGKKPSFVSRCLSGQQNMTIRTIHDLARGMDSRIEVTFRPLKSLRVRNYDINARLNLDGNGRHGEDATDNKLLEIRV